jgi:hypothetical protein
MVVSRLLDSFLTLWRSFFGGLNPSTSQPFPGNQPRPIAPTERISRYVLDKKQFDGLRVKFRAFEPPAAETAISVTRSSGLTDHDVWAHGDRWVAAAGGRTIYARGDFTAASIVDVRSGDHLLSVSPDEPPPRHANLVGYPTIKHKEVRKSLAQQMAAIAQVVPRS